MIEFTPFDLMILITCIFGIIICIGIIAICNMEIKTCDIYINKAEKAEEDYCNKNVDMYMYNCDTYYKSCIERLIKKDMQLSGMSRMETIEYRNIEFNC